MKWRDGDPISSNGISAFTEVIANTTAAVAASTNHMILSTKQLIFVLVLMKILKIHNSYIDHVNSYNEPSSEEETNKENDSMEEETDEEDDDMSKRTFFP